jgi:hypothetical protein
VKKKTQPPDNKQFESAVLAPDIASLINEHSEGEQVGQTSRVDKLDDVFKWFPGTLNAFYGWANDGKGTFYEFLAVMRAKLDNKKFCMMRQEDISSTKYKGEAPKITSNRIFKSLAWMLTGKCPYKGFAEKNKIPQIDRNEYMEALLWLEEHFYIVNPKDRSWPAVMGLFQFMYEKYGIDHFEIDPWKSIKMGTDDRRADHQLDDMFIEGKEFAVKTNTTLDIIAHPKSLQDVRVGKQPDSPFKVVTQFHIAGGAAWDNNMDAQYSIYRPERHLNPRDPSVEFHNLKQRNSEEVGAQRGIVRGIKFDRLTHRYYFDGVCPLDGSFARGHGQQTAVDYTAPKFEAPQPVNDNDLPF